MRRHSPWLHLLWCIPVAALLFWFVYPLVNVWTVSLQGTGWSGWVEFFSSRLLWHTLHIGFLQALLSTIFTLIVAMPLVVVWLLYDFRGKQWLQALVSLPFVLPTVVVAAGFRALWGAEGLLNRLIHDLMGFPMIDVGYGWGPVIIAHVFYNISVVFRIVTGFGARIDPGILESALCLGASPFVAARRVLLPLLQPAIRSASLLVFLFCFGSFGVVLILGGQAMSTLDTEIYRQTVHFFHLSAAALLSMVQLFFTLLVIALHSLLGAKSLNISLAGDAGEALLGEPATARAKSGVTLFALGYGATLGMPLAAILIQAIWGKAGPSLEYFLGLFRNERDAIFFVPPIAAVMNSLEVAICAVIFCLVIGFPAAQFLALSPSRIKRALHAGFLLPLSASPVTLGLGFIVTFAAAPFDFRTSWLLLPVSHALVAFPLFLQSVLPALRSVPDSLRQAAATLGAAPFTVWLRVEMPMIRVSLIAAMVLCMMISLGEFGATAFIARPYVPTMPVAIYRYLSQPGAQNYGQAMAMSVLLLGVTGAGFALLQRIGKQR
jgi:thiamine transport system permease protein